MDNRRQKKQITTVYSPCEINMKITLPMVSVGKNLHQILETNISNMVSGKCINEGYVKRGSVKVISNSSGILKGENVLFDVIFQCMVCYPANGMNLNCVAKTITKAGIQAESSDESPSPFIFFVARDHNYASDYFNSIKVGDKFIGRVIAQRFELNDQYVSVIGELVPQRDYEKPRLTIE